MYASFLDHTDHHVVRLIDAIQDLRVLASRRFHHVRDSPPEDDASCRVRARPSGPIWSPSHPPRVGDAVLILVSEYSHRRERTAGRGPMETAPGHN